MLLVGSCMDLDHAKSKSAEHRESSNRSKVVFMFKMLIIIIRFHLVCLRGH